MKKKKNILYSIIKIAWIILGIYILISFGLGISDSLASENMNAPIQVLILILLGGVFFGTYIIITILFLLGKWIFKKAKK